MPLPFVANPLANTELPKVQAGALVDGFDADRDGVVPDQWTLFFSSDSQANGRALRNSTSVENRLQIALPPGVNWVMECEFVLVSGTPDESFQLYNSTQDNANKYLCGMGSSSSRLAIAKNVANTFTNLSTTGAATDIPTNTPVRFRFTRLGTTLTGECPGAGSMAGARLSVTDAALSGPFYAGFDSYAGAAKVTRINWVRIARLA
jgi:hypothetical protein